jgi:hypothetical protein
MQNVLTIRSRSSGLRVGNVLAYYPVLFRLFKDEAIELGHYQFRSLRAEKAFLDRGSAKSARQIKVQGKHHEINY